MRAGYDHAGPFFVVLNRASGSSDASEVQAAIEHALTRAGRAYRVLCAQRPSALPALAAEAVALAKAQGGAVVVAGGDGTINAVAQAVLPSGLPFGALPQGTFNFFGRCHGLPEGDAGEAVAALLDADEVPVEVGQVNGRVFLVNASVGLYPEVLEQRERDKRRLGRHRWVALVSGLGVLLGRYPTLHLTLRSDEGHRQLRGATLVVCSNRLQLEQLGVPEADRLGEGELVGIVAPRLPRWRMIGAAVRGLLGRLGETPIESFAFRELDVSLRRAGPVKVAIDGEIARMRPPLRFAVASQRLRLLVPRRTRP